MVERPQPPKRVQGEVRHPVAVYPAVAWRHNAVDDQVTARGVWRHHVLVLPAFPHSDDFLPPPFSRYDVIAEFHRSSLNCLYDVTGVGDDVYEVVVGQTYRSPSLRFYDNRWFGLALVKVAKQPLESGQSRLQVHGCHELAPL